MFPDKILRAVDLPVPFDPTSPSTSPAAPDDAAGIVQLLDPVSAAAKEEGPPAAFPFPSPPEPEPLSARGRAPGRPGRQSSTLSADQFADIISERRTLVANAAPGSAVLRVTVNGREATVRPRVWFNAQ